MKTKKILAFTLAAAILLSLGTPFVFAEECTGDHTVAQGEATATTPATCTAAATATYTCATCSQSYTITVGVANGHSYGPVGAINDYVKYPCYVELGQVCSACGDLKHTGVVDGKAQNVSWGGTTITTKEHTWKLDEKRTTAATCKTGGSELYYCTVCGNEKTVTTAADGSKHVWGAWKITKEATCGEAGSKTRTCSKCNTTETQTIAKDADSHKFGEWKETVAATATSTGTKARTCSVCKFEETETIPKLGGEQTADDFWAAIGANITSAATSGNESLTINCSGYETVPASILTMIKQSGVRTVLSMGSFVWIIEPDSIADSIPESGYDLMVSQTADDAISAYAGDSEIIQFVINHTGELPFTGTLKFKVGSGLIGKTVYLYRYLGSDGIEAASSAVVDENSFANFALDHCSAYVATTDQLSGAKKPSSGGDDGASGGGMLSGINWLLVGGIAAGVAVIVIIIIAVSKRKRDTADNEDASEILYGDNSGRATPAKKSKSSGKYVPRH